MSQESISFSEFIERLNFEKMNHEFKSLWLQLIGNTIQIEPNKFKRVPDLRFYCEGTENSNFCVMRKVKAGIRVYFRLDKLKKNCPFAEQLIYDKNFATYKSNWSYFLLTEKKDIDKIVEKILWVKENFMPEKFN